MSYQPWYQGQDSPLLQISLNLDSKPDDITGLIASNFAMAIRNTNTNTDANGTGTFAIVSAYPAVITYDLSSADVATAGTYELIIAALFPNGTKKYDPIQFAITAV